MNQETAWQNFSKLPPEAQQEVVDFIAFLQTRYSSRRATPPTTSWAQEGFIGMWQDRQDLQDSTEWVRERRAG